MNKPEVKSTEQPLFVIALAASAGGLRALSRVLLPLPVTFKAAIVIVQHLSPRHTSYLADILSRRTQLKVKEAQDQDQLHAGVVYVAPPNWHLLIQAHGRLALTQTAPRHFVRPSADALFESLARWHTDHAIAVVLTGMGVDGAEGIKNVKAQGGTVIAQDEASAEFFYMPDAAIKTGCVDYILPLNSIAGFLERLILTE
jgi:two-component system, chemotaxis family, protein-glutamate methylesterase/glutaminase